MADSFQSANQAWHGAPDGQIKSLTYTYIICILPVMNITWDPNKAKVNFKKHGVRFSDAEMVLYDSFALTLEEHIVASERRYVTVGADAIGRILAVVYSCRSDRSDTIRLISARKATRGERKQYEEGI